jgi:hypothetical protein
MKKIKRFKDFKKKSKTSIKKVSDKPFSFVPIVNKMSPAPAVAFGISKINLD